MKTRILHRSEKELIRILFREARPISVHELAELSGMSWITAKKYLNKGLKRGVIAARVMEKSTYYIMSKELLAALQNKRGTIIENQQ